MIKNSKELIKAANESAIMLMKRHNMGNKSCLFIDGAIKGYYEGYAEGIRDGEALVNAMNDANEN